MPLPLALTGVAVREAKSIVLYVRLVPDRSRAKERGTIGMEEQVE